MHQLLLQLTVQIPPPSTTITLVHPTLLSPYPLLYPLQLLERAEIVSCGLHKLLVGRMTKTPLWLSLPGRLLLLRKMDRWAGVQVSSLDLWRIEGHPLFRFQRQRRRMLCKVASEELQHQIQSRLLPYLECPIPLHLHHIVTQSTCLLRHHLSKSGSQLLHQVPNPLSEKYRCLPPDMLQVVS